MSRTHSYFVTGIGTDIGKTVVAAILTEVLHADYWKPVQAGGLDQSDTLKVQSLISNPHSQFHPEAYRLSQPQSPHAAASLDGISIQLDSFHLPDTQRPLIVEGAGGLLVPLNTQSLMVDLISHLGLPVILVSKNYLGSINHTLLSIEALQNRNISLEGIIFNGLPTPATESIILDYTGVDCLGRITEEPEVTPAMIKKYANQWDQRFLFPNPP